MCFWILPLPGKKWLRSKKRLWTLALWKFINIMTARWMCHFLWMCSFYGEKVLGGYLLTEWMRWGFIIGVLNLSFLCSLPVWLRCSELSAQSAAISPPLFQRWVLGPLSQRAPEDWGGEDAQWWSWATPHCWSTPELAMFYGSSKIEDLRKEYSRSITTTTTTISSVL